MRHNKKNLNIALATLLSFTLSVAMNAQEGNVSGIVNDENEILVGASIIVVGTTMGTITDIDGKYSLTLNVGVHVLQASFIGYTSQEITVTISLGGSITANFTLQSSSVEIDQIVITGTRSKPRSAIKSPVPIDNFSIKEIERQGNGDMTEVLKNLVPSYTATPRVGDGAAFVRSTSMRGLPPDDVLILMNSKRRHRSALIAHFGAAMNAGSHAADVGHIPSIALKNVEVLRDGAAAQYGSDAIAGVINFILKDNTEGVEVQTQIGKWYGRNYGSETDYKVAVNFGLPLTAKGFINISTEYSYNEELSRGNQPAVAQEAIDAGVEGISDPAQNHGRPESSGLRSVWNAGLDLTNNTKLYSFGNFSKTYGNYGFFYRERNKPGYLTPVPKDPNDPSKGNFCLCDAFPGGYTPNLEGFQTDISGVLGVKGVVDVFGGLNYDVSVSFGHNRLNYTLNNTLNPSWGSSSQTVFQPGDLQQAEKNFNIDLSKELSENFHLAGGFEARNETYTMYVGDLQSYTAGPWAAVGNLINPETSKNYLAPGLSSHGLAGTSPDAAGSWESKNWALYLDAEWDVSDALLVQTAIRYEDFKEFGETFNYKIAGRYTVSNVITFRGAVSTGFRAPTSGQANVTTITTDFDGMGQQIDSGTLSSTDPIAVSLGGKALVPEASENYSFGVTSRIDRLNITADVYHVNEDKRIVKSQNIAVVGFPEFQEVSFYSNALNARTHGLDLVFSWKSAARDTNLSLAYNYNETKVLGQVQVNGVDPVTPSTIFNIENNLPKHRATGIISQQFGKLEAMVRANFYGNTIDERGDREEVGAETLFDLHFNYEASETMTLVLGSNNILNNYPDKIETRLSIGMPFPRRSPIGYQGGMVYMRVVYKR